MSASSARLFQHRTPQNKLYIFNLCIVFADARKKNKVKLLTKLRCIVFNSLFHSTNKTDEIIRYDQVDQLLLQEERREADLVGAQGRDQDEVLDHGSCCCSAGGKSKPISNSSY